MLYTVMFQKILMLAQLRALLSSVFGWDERVEAAGTDTETRLKALTKANAGDLVGAVESIVDAHLNAVDSSQTGLRARAHQTQQVITGLVIVIVVSVSVVIVSAFNRSLGGVKNNALSNAQASVLQAFADMVGLIAPLLLIIIAVVIVAYVQKMRSA